MAACRGSETRPCAWRMSSGKTQLSSGNDKPSCDRSYRPDRGKLRVIEWVDQVDGSCCKPIHLGFENLYSRPRDRVREEQDNAGCLPWDRAPIQCPTGAAYQARRAARLRAAAALIALSRAISSGVSSNLNAFFEPAAVFLAAFRRSVDLGWLRTRMTNDSSSTGLSCKCQHGLLRQVVERVTGEEVGAEMAGGFPVSAQVDATGDADIFDCAKMLEVGDAGRI
jgi:hypothetical protein